MISGGGTCYYDDEPVVDDGKFCKDHMPLCRDCWSSDSTRDDGYCDACRAKKTIRQVAEMPPTWWEVVHSFVGIYGYTVSSNGRRFAYGLASATRLAKSLNDSLLRLRRERHPNVMRGIGHYYVRQIPD